MSKVSFYLIEKKPLRQADLACRLCQKIYPKHRIWFYCKTQTMLEDWDLNLWNFDPSSFLPHAIDDLLQPICLSLQPPNISFDVCFNLSGQVINLDQLPNSDIHIIEIIENNEQDKQIARERFKQYRQLGIEPVIHRI